MGVWASGCENDHHLPALAVLTPVRITGVGIMSSIQVRSQADVLTSFAKAPCCASYAKQIIYLFVPVFNYI